MLCPNRSFGDDLQHKRFKKGGRVEIHVGDKSKEKSAAEARCQLTNDAYAPAMKGKPKTICKSAERTAVREFWSSDGHPEPCTQYLRETKQ